eukprot:TRINITY_DN11862_c0_g1_i1.p1 TRINITY_DN11862_c0_g1~~TRINITY_DN11862_c0_g1_i1.p1  ORF type:complete len:281 (+),score=44.04 TRINITY_DN11862_c0_g1_i1:85-927(+)
MGQVASFVQSRFTEGNPAKYSFYVLTTLCVCVGAVVALVEPFLGEGNCDPSKLPPTVHYGNVDASRDPCYTVRRKELLYLSPEDCLWFRRIMFAGLLGACVGYERRGADRPAGVRTMVCIAVAAALFTLNAQLAFRLGPMAWDGARVAAALPAGVGFIGAGMIWKQTKGMSVQKVNGLTTAACVWVSAALGVAAGGGLFFNGLFTLIVTLNLLRFGPMHALQDDEEEEEPAKQEPESAGTGWQAEFLERAAAKQSPWFGQREVSPERTQSMRRRNPQYAS